MARQFIGIATLEPLVTEWNKVLRTQDRPKVIQSATMKSISGTASMRFKRNKLILRLGE